MRRTSALIIMVVTTFTLISCTSVKTFEKRAQEIIPDPIAYLVDRGLPAYPCSDVTLFNTGREWNAHTLKRIAEAKEYILVALFLGNIHEASYEVWDALAAKVEEGVDVYVLLDSSSYFQLTPHTNLVVPAAFNYARDVGLKVAEYNPMSASHAAFLPLLLDRDHRKFWIFDGEYLAVGGINLNEASLMIPPETGNIDTMVEIQSPKAIEALVDSFIRTWRRYSVEPIDREAFSIPPKEGLSKTVYLGDHYVFGSNSVTDLFDALILGAQNEVWMIQGYSFLTKELINRIREATDRGVKVNVVLSENAVKVHYEKAAFFGMVDLIDAGATLYLFDGPHHAFLHLKLIVTDDRYVLFGSANYNLRSQVLSREIGFLFDDVEIASRALEHVSFIIDHSRVVDREEAETHRGIDNRFFNFLMQFIG
ncbi:MAG: phosphatidylserine/phosphatidylglycerophosphate/cardiolipin synthase family protein [Spirochaetales bacterium]|nr:phosphatidylserine/phosphatidylglycerophosphate/cardiolipin synthase family protein [Spirochaetales bacterium]